MDLPNIVYSQTNTAIEWSITAVRTRNQEGRDVIVQLSWTMLGTRLDSANQPVSALRSGTLVLDYDPNNFIPYADLSQAQLINWVNTKLGVDKINSLRAEINVELDSHLLTEQSVPA
jgi:hypothetical protein